MFVKQDIVDIFLEDTVDTSTVTKTEAWSPTQYINGNTILISLINLIIIHTCIRLYIFVCVCVYILLVKPTARKHTTY